MRVLVGRKIRTCQQLQSTFIIAHRKCTMVCVYMAIVLLASSLLYELLYILYVDAADTVMKSKQEALFVL